MDNKYINYEYVISKKEKWELKKVKLPRDMPVQEVIINMLENANNNCDKE